VSYLVYAARRVLLAVIAVYVVVTGTVVAMYPVLDGWVAAKIREIRYRKISDLEKQELIDLVRRQYEVDRTLQDRLVDWWVDVPTVDWGMSITQQEPVVAVLEGRILRTAEYLLPGLVLALGLGVLLGLAVALTRSRLLDLGTRVTAYSLLGVPVFMVCTYVITLSGSTVGVLGVDLGFPGLDRKTIAALGVALAVLAGQLRFARATALEHRGQLFMKTLRAKGLGRLGLARHLFRNVAGPLVSLSITELLGALVITIYVVEAVCGIDGLGAVSLAAARQGDLPLLVGTVLVVVYLGIAARLCQDLVAGYIDPRVRAD
jgi:peptide/nickel transport system permease protein